MPVTLTYPGVYIEELSSGVRTITGVSTSVTAFAGLARRGPINRAVRLLSYSDFERRFGGLSADSQLSYAVRQFFANGGSEAWVVRLARNVVAASRGLVRANGDAVLKLTALDEGFAGNEIEVRVDYGTPPLASNFNLTLNYKPAAAPQDSRSETFPNLSMNSKDRRYAPTIINGVSQLVTVERVATPAMIGALTTGNSISGELTEGGALIDVGTKLDATHDQFQVVVNNSDPVTVQLAAADLGADPALAARLGAICNAIAVKVAAQAAANPKLAGFTCAPSGNRILMTSGVGGEESSVRVLPGLRNDLAPRLKLGAANGGAETDAAAALRPVLMPDQGKLTSGALAAGDVPTAPADALPKADKNSFKISLDGETAEEITLTGPPAANGTLNTRLDKIAELIQQAVAAKKPARRSFADFTAQREGNNLVLCSGTRGEGSAVLVSAADANDIAATLKLLAGSSATAGKNEWLQGGTESAYTDADAYNVFIGDRSLRKGIYALEAVDLFNILCLPGVSDAGILQDAAAYCFERRAFLIIDPPATTTQPAAMGTLVTGSTLPKSSYAAVYYPWIRIADPLQGGQLRAVPPSGTIAGLFARTDSTRGVWKAPAGTEATLVGALGVEYALTDLENGTLNPLGANCIRSFPVYGVVAWGARTLRGADQMTDEWKYVPVRRLALYIEESLYRGTKWVVFEPNDEPLWAQIRLNVGAFMNNLFRQGAFKGRSPRDAYFVKCDGETTTQNDINLGIVNILVGFAPLKPAEFVVIKLQQMAGQVEA